MAVAPHLRFLGADVSATDRQHDGQVTGIAVVGTRLITAGVDQRVLSFESLAESHLQFVGPELRASKPFGDLQAVQEENPSRILVAGACQHQDIRLWQVERVAQDAGRAVFRPLTGHEAPVCALDFLTKHNQHFLVSASEDATARVWDLSIDSEVVALGHPRGVTRSLFFPGTTMVATLCLDTATRVWDLRENATRPAAVLQELGATGEETLSLAIASGDQKLLATGAGDGTVRLYDVPRCGAACLSTFQLPCSARALHFVMEDRYLACAGADGDLYTVRLADLAAQSFAVQEQEPKRPITLLKGGTLQGSHVLAYTFESHGWGFGKLEEGEPEDAGATPAPAGNEHASRAAAADQD